MQDYEVKTVCLVEEDDVGPGWGCTRSIPTSQISDEQITRELRGGWRIVAAVQIDGEPWAIAQRPVVTGATAPEEE